MKKTVVLCAAVMPVELKAIHGVSTLNYKDNLIPCLEFTTSGNRAAHYPIVTFSGDDLEELKQRTLKHICDVFAITEEDLNEHRATVSKS